MIVVGNAKEFIRTPQKIVCSMACQATSYRHEVDTRLNNRISCHGDMPLLHDMKKQMYKGRNIVVHHD
jgi:hypothetical protein